MGVKVYDTFTMRVISTFLSEAAAVKSREKKYHWTMMLWTGDNSMKIT